MTKAGLTLRQAADKVSKDVIFPGTGLLPGTAELQARMEAAGKPYAHTVIRDQFSMTTFRGHLLTDEGVRGLAFYLRLDAASEAKLFSARDADRAQWHTRLHGILEGTVKPEVMRDTQVNEGLLYLNALALELNHPSARIWLETDGYNAFESQQTRNGFAHNILQNASLGQMNPFIKNWIAAACREADLPATVIARLDHFFTPMPKVGGEKTAIRLKNPPEKCAEPVPPRA